MTDGELIGESYRADGVVTDAPTVRTCIDVFSDRPRSARHVRPAGPVRTPRTETRGDPGWWVSFGDATAHCPSTTQRRILPAA